MYKMSYGTILVMALICFMLGSSERMPWAAVNESQEAVAVAVAGAGAGIGIGAAFESETDEPETAEPKASTMKSTANAAVTEAVALTDAPAAPLIKIQVRQQYALLRYYAHEDASAEQCRQFLLTRQPHPGCTAFPLLTCAQAP